MHNATRTIKLYQLVTRYTQTDTKKQSRRYRIAVRIKFITYYLLPKINFQTRIIKI